MWSNSSGVDSCERLLLLKTPVLHDSKISLPVLAHKIDQMVTHTSSIYSIVDPAEFLNGFQYKLVDLLGAGDICLDD
jgi:hypothetical protein